MSDESTQSPNQYRAAALAAFDTARDGFLAAFAQAPDAALAYLPAGDDYALGALPKHLCDSMRHYLAVLDLVQAAGYGPLDLTQTGELAAATQRHDATVALQPMAADRQRLLGDLDTTHAEVRQRTLSLDAEDFARQAPVIYTPSAAPYPTSCADILGWLRDHYAEHETQVTQMLAAWAQRQSGAV